VTQADSLAVRGKALQLHLALMVEYLGDIACELDAMGAVAILSQMCSFCNHWLLLLFLFLLPPVDC